MLAKMDPEGVGADGPQSPGSFRERVNWATLLLLGATLVGCASSPPRNTADLCSIFKENPDWYEAALNAQRGWGVPVAVQMAIIRHESSFVEDAQPPREWFLFIPLERPSSAYGFSQALDGTWEDYQRSTGNSGADRDDFNDSVDFVGWYLNESARRLGIPKQDAYRHYLAYHEGVGGYRKGSYRRKSWLMGVANRVARTARHYRHQLNGCQGELDEALD